MSLKLNSSGGGSVTLQEPSTASALTLTLPTTTGTAVIQNASNNLLMNSGYGSDAVAYGCRAWVNFTGAGTLTVRASGNVTSVTDNGVGDYTVNFTTAMPDANYAMGAAGEVASGTNYNVIQFNQNTSPTTSAVRLTSLNQSGGVPAVFDSARVTVAIFR